MGKKSRRKSQKKAKDDDLILDFTWLKNIFNIKKTKSTKKKKDEDITIDFKSLAKTFSKYSVLFLIWPIEYLQQNLLVFVRYWELYLILLFP